MGLRAILTATAVAVLATGCYVESAQDRAPQAGDINRSNKNDDGTEAGICRFAIGKGCFDGHVVAKREFFVDGKQFFDANDLAARFSELINVDSLGKKLSAEAAEDGYKIELITQVDNNSFLSEFEYDVTGEVVRTGKLRNNGNFSVNDLTQGTYDLSVRKAIKFKLSAEVKNPAADQQRTPVEGEPTTTVPATLKIEKIFCGTLFAESVVDVLKGKRGELAMISDFRLHVTDNECATGGSNTTLSLDP